MIVSEEEAKKKKTWGEIFQKHVSKGMDHGSAAELADRYIARLSGKPE